MVKLLSLKGTGESRPTTLTDRRSALPNVADSSEQRARGAREQPPHSQRNPAVIRVRPAYLPSRH